MKTELWRHPSIAADPERNRRVEAALNQLPPRLQLLNRIYLRNVEQKRLLSAAEAATWLGHTVTVFLRHDKVSVFSVVCEQSVAMADFVTLHDATFHVNQTGRIQSNAGLGPLPNTRTVHAYLTGSLQVIANHGKVPAPELWEPVYYHPTKYESFVRQESSQPVTTSRHVELVPGKQKVWCPRLSDGGLPEDFGGDLP